MSRRPSVAVARRNEPVVQRIQALKVEHPFWGYRRIWAHLRFVEWLRITRNACCG
jgi:putative transposase